MACGTESEQQGKYKWRSEDLTSHLIRASCNSEDKENEVALTLMSSNIIRTILITSGINISCFRLDQSGSLQVDNGDTVRARAPGHLTQLNTNPTLFLGECSSKLNIEHPIPALDPVLSTPKQSTFPSPRQLSTISCSIKISYTEASRGRNNFKVCHFTS